MHNYWIITVLTFSKNASPILAQRKKFKGKLRLLVDLRRIRTLNADDYTTINHPVSILSDAAQRLAGKSLFCKLDCSQVYHYFQMVDQGLHSISLAQPLPTKDLHKVSTDLCLLFLSSMQECLSQLSKLINVLNTWKILELQPTLLRILPGKFGHSISAFAMQGLN